MDTEAEQQLVERMSGGDAAALELLLQGHLPGLRGFVRLRAGRLLREREEDTDLVQSICREVLQHRERFQFPGSNGFKRWLYTTALRKLNNRREYYLAQKRDVGRDVGQLPDGSHGAASLLECYGTMCTPSRELMAREALERVEQAIDGLPDDYREALTLSRMVGLTRAEIALEMGRSEASVRMLLSRAQARLAELLDVER